MIFAGSLVTCVKDSLPNVVDYLKSFPQVEVYTVSEEKNSIVVAIEEENDESLENLCSKLRDYPDIIHIAHHYFNFEEEVEKIGSGAVTELSLKGFSKSEQRKERDTLNEY